MAMPTGRIDSRPLSQGKQNNEVVISNIIYFHPYLGKWSNLTHIFQMGWNHQLDKFIGRISCTCVFFWGGKEKVKVHILNVSDLTHVVFLFDGMLTILGGVELSQETCNKKRQHVVKFKDTDQF